VVTLLRSALFNALFVGLTAVMGLAAIPTLLLHPGVIRRGLRLWAACVLWLLRIVAGIRVRVTGREHLPAAGPALVAAKHQSAFDTIVWFALLPDAAYVLKRELLRIPVYGWHARHAGMIAVDRGAGAAAMRGLIRDALAALAGGRQVVMFPEGTRMPPGQSGRYQPGIAALYARAGLPVVPVATDSGRVWGRRSFMKRPGTVTVAVLPPILPGLSRTGFIAELRQRIESESTALLQRVGSFAPVDKAGDSVP
jgi:1-acyl-sn-glycerol-3-phosphate acyltransferase